MALIPAVSTASHSRQIHIERVAPLSSRFDVARARIREFVSQRVFLGAAREVASVLETGDREALLRAAPGWRARARRFGLPTAAAMEQALEGVAIRRAEGLAADAAWIESERFDVDGTLVYVPGGSFVVGMSPRLTAMVARIAKAAGARTCIVEYRLAPEHPCPAAVDDVESVIATLASEWPGRRIAVLAESAGAAVALAAVRRLRDRDIAIAGVCLLSPWTDLALTGLSLVTRSLSRGSATRMEFPAVCAHLYLQGRSPVDPVASPVYGDLSGLPPMLVHTSRGDAFHDDARALSERAFNAGTEVTLRVWPGREHAFEQGFSAQSARAIADAGTFLRTRLAA